MPVPFDPDKRAPATPEEAAAAGRKERAQAANALIGWFNTQDIAMADAERIMSLVLAKILCARTRPDVFEYEKVVSEHQLQLVHDMNDRLHVTRRLPPRG